VIRWFIVDDFAESSGLDAPWFRLIGVVCALNGCGRFDFAESSPDAAVDGAPALAWDHLIAYGDQTCATFHGVAYCWGDDTSNQLGVPEATVYARVPTAVLLPPGTVTALSEGANDGCAIVDDVAYCYGALSSKAPKSVGLNDVRAIGAGNGFLCATSGTAVSCWGTNADAGQLAIGDTVPHPSPTPTLLTHTTQFVLGDDHGCAIDGGVAVCWGHNDYGTLGQGGMIPDFSATPLGLIDGSTSLPLIGGWHACSLAAGAVKCWGEGDHGEIGNGAMTNTGTPTLVSGLADVTALAVGGGPDDYDASCAIHAGRVSCWGAGNHGRLGQGTNDNSASPIEMTLPASALTVAIGYDHACALLVTDEIWCWGAGTKGQLGNGLMTDSYPPVLVTAP
jgi:alpha-tubulin suppressor-like RCC1 family protein